jgi:predicted dehydrogenase
MPTQPLPVAVIGVGGFGGLTLQALRNVASVKVVGVSDRNPTVAERAGRTAGVPAYSDNRSLLAETHPSAVYLAVPPMAGPELVTACAERGIAVWKEPPLARNLDEGVALVRRMERAGLKFAVGTQRRFATGYRKAWELRAWVGPVFLARAHYLFNWGPELGWRADRASAGGGALLELGYHPIDLMIWLLGMPEDVYGLSARAGRLRTAQTEAQTERVYDTDDTAAALLRFPSGAMASVVTTRSSGPVSEELSLHGRSGSLTATSEMCTLRDPDGNVLDGVRTESGPVAVLQRQAEAFAAAVASDSPTYECSGLENLLNLAVIEAIYLSDSTCQPENPSRLLASRGLSVEDCLRHQPGQPVAPAPAPPGEEG